MASSAAIRPRRLSRFGRTVRGGTTPSRVGSIVGVGGIVPVGDPPATPAWASDGGRAVPSSVTDGRVPSGGDGETSGSTGRQPHSQLGATRPAGHRDLTAVRLR